MDAFVEITMSIPVEQVRTILTHHMLTLLDPAYPLASHGRHGSNGHHPTTPHPEPAAAEEEHPPAARAGVP